MKPYNDKLREMSFKQAYDIDSEIWVKNVFDKDYNWVTAEIMFKYKGNTYSLKEYFKDGEDNSTDYVVLSYMNGEEKIEHKFKNYLDAEIKLVFILEEL